MVASEKNPTRVIIVGGGVAALEAMLAIRELGGARVKVDLFAPRRDFVLKPLGVSEAFGRGDALTYDLETLASNAGARFHLRGVTGIDRRHRLVLAHDDEKHPYDFLVVATGTKAIWVVPGAKTFWGLQGQEMISDLLASSAETELGHLVLTMPEPAVWPLPIYELALFLAAEAEGSSPAAEISIVTPEDAPLRSFGEPVSEQMRSLLDASSIRIVTGTTPLGFADGQLETSAGPIAADRVITLPRLTGRRIEGLPFDESGFLPVDGLGLIEGCTHEYAAGDVISYPIKFGGAATAQADVVAAAIGAKAWDTPRPEPFEPDLQATLLTPDGPVPDAGIDGRKEQDEIMNDTDHPKVLILYASTHGQTEKIAKKLAVAMGLNDLDVAVKDLQENEYEVPSDYDAVVLAASIHAGHHQREMVNWVHRNIDELADRPNAFVSVSLSSAEEDEEARAAGQKYIEDFTRDTRWYPDHTEPVAGALLYREYNPFTRTLMRLIMRKGGHPTDSSHDYEYTDWDALARFGQELSADFKGRIAASRPVAR